MFTLYIPKTYVDLIIVISVVSKMLVLNKHIPVEPSQKRHGDRSFVSCRKVVPIFNAMKLIINTCIIVYM